MRITLSLVALFIVAPWAVLADDIDTKYPLDPVLKVLADDVRNPSYRELVLKKMLITDLAAEWQRVQTADNPDSFLAKHGGKEKVLADPELKRAYERRVQIRTDYLALMREGYQRYKQVPPFDKGAKAEVAGTVVKNPEAAKVAVRVVMPAVGAEKHWPRFRGPTGQGHASAKSLPVHWSKSGEGIVWRKKLPGHGNSSPVTWGDQIFLTAATADGASRWLLSLSAVDGAIQWQRDIPSSKPEPGVREKNGFASSTPVTDGERVIAFCGSSGLVCFDMAGKQIWHYSDLQIRTTHGAGSSPLLLDDKVIFIHDQNQIDSICVALDKRAGTKVWQVPRPRAMTWCTPIAVRVENRTEILFAGGETVTAYDPANGKELWTLRGPTQEVVPTIVVGPHLLYSASGRNGPTLAFRPGGAGDVSQSHLVWRAVRGGPHVPSPILVGPHLYTINDTGIATCFDAENGKLIWQERLPSPFSASPIEAGGLIYCCSEKGITFVLRAGSKFDVVAKNDLGSPILASPAVIGERIVIRTQEELVCVGAK